MKTLYAKNGFPAHILDFKPTNRPGLSIGFTNDGQAYAKLEGKNTPTQVELVGEMTVGDLVRYDVKL